MAQRRKKKIGVIGYGQIGSSLCEQLSQDLRGDLEVACIHESSPAVMAKVPKKLAAASVEEMLNLGLDLVVEAAHPDAVRRYAELVLARADLMIMSVSAMGDTRLEEAIKGACQRHGTHLYIPHGATLGLDGLRDGISLWEEVSITMRKNPRNLNFNAALHLKPAEGAGEVVIYDGPTRGILPLFPKNVNSHATLALATLGLDKTRSILVSDPRLDESVIEIDAKGGGASIHIERRNPIKGVTGKLTILSVVQSLRNIVGEEGFLRTC
jgi:aspartate dehydrogenase